MAEGHHDPMRYHRIIPESFVDGPGQRAVLFLQGCSLACPGCQNQHLWNAQGGQSVSPQALAGQLVAANPQAVTISGGEPFQQAAGLAALLDHLRFLSPHIHIIVYTGYCWCELPQVIPTDLLARILSQIDILVDGRFIREQDNGLMQYRGSANQRPIDVRATLGAGGALVIEDWDTPEIIITPTGDLLMPVGLDFALDDTPAATTRRCGQTAGPGMPLTIRAGAG